MWHTLLLLFLGTEVDTVSLIQVTVDEVSKLLKTPKVAMTFLKKCADAWAPSLTFLINLA